MESVVQVSLVIRKKRESAEWDGADVFDVSIPIFRIFALPRREFFEALSPSRKREEYGSGSGNEPHRAGSHVRHGLDARAMKSAGALRSRISGRLGRIFRRCRRDCRADLCLPSFPACSTVACWDDHRVQDIGIHQLGSFPRRPRGRAARRIPKEVQAPRELNEL